MKGTDIKCLWGTANMFSNPRFMCGAGSTNSADVFCFAAAQVKKALDITVKLGGLTGGFNFDSKNRRPSYTFEDMFYAFILGMDTFALGLIKAAELIEDGRIDNFIKERYQSFESGIGKKIRDNSVDLKELSDYALNMKAPSLPISGRQEYLESVVNNVLFKG